jgi:hypothetical protein
MTGLEHPLVELGDSRVSFVQFCDWCECSRMWFPDVRLAADRPCRNQPGAAVLRYPQAAGVACLVECVPVSAPCHFPSFSCSDWLSVSIINVDESVARSCQRV